MKFTLDWLKDHLDTTATADEIAEALTTIGLEVESVEVLLKARSELESKGLTVVGPTNHDDFILSIYFFDPSGHRLELTARTCHDPARMQGFADEAPEVLALWEKTHDWSQREALFGAKSGYARQEAESTT